MRPRSCASLQPRGYNRGLTRNLQIGRPATFYRRARNHGGPPIRWCRSAKSPTPGKLWTHQRASLSHGEVNKKAPDDAGAFEYDGSQISYLATTGPPN